MFLSWVHRLHALCETEAEIRARVKVTGKTHHFIFVELSNRVNQEQIALNVDWER